MQLVEEYESISFMTFGDFFKCEIPFSHLKGQVHLPYKSFH